MNSKAKFNVAARLGQEAANNLKKLKQPEFELCLAKYLKLNKFISELSKGNKLDDDDEQDNAEAGPQSKEDETCSSNNFTFTDKNLVKGAAVGRNKEHKQK